MKNTLLNSFYRLRTKNKSSLILYTTAGDPSMDVTREVLWYAQKIGVDCLELGIPFSDPIADGPVIQASSYRAVVKGVSLKGVLQLVRDERRRGLTIPIALMGSVNPILAMGVDTAATRMQQSGINGLIMPDLPYREGRNFRKKINIKGVDCILMTTPTTTPENEKMIVRNSKGFIYYVSLVGLTGATNRKSYNFKEHVKKLRKKTSTPICVGFGVSTPQQVRDISSFADGVIIGSALVSNLWEYSKTSLSTRSKKLMRSWVQASKSRTLSS